MKTKGWTIKTKTGMINPSWIFDTSEEAERELEHIQELFRMHKYSVVEVEIATK